MTTYNQPLVSILIPAYNPNFFSECLKSALDQTYKNFEIILCDDSPSEKINDIVESFKSHKNFSRLTYIKNEVNLGEAENFTKLYLLADGELIKYLNDDDLLAPDCLEIMVSYFEKYGDQISLVTSKRQLINEKSEFLRDINTTTPPKLPSADEKHIYASGDQVVNLVMSTVTNFIGEPSTVLFPKKLLKKNKGNIFSINGKRIFGNGDLTMWYNLLHKGNFVYIYKTLSYFRLHGSQSQQNPNNIYLCKKHWYLMLEELPKLGFLQDKKIFYYSLRHIYNTLNYEEMQGFSPEQKDDFANIKKEIAEKLDILEQELLYCPVCCHYVSEFLPLSDYYAENAKKYGCIFKTEDFEMINEKQYSCPICYASDRERFYALFINYMKEKILNENENQKVKIVDFAPSLSLGKFIKNQNLFEYRTADLFMENVDDKVDITDLNIYKTGSFDAFICSHVLEHVIDDKKALRELYRILKPSGGWGILVVPIHLTLEHIYEDPSKTSPEERWMHFGQDDHVRVYSKNGFRERISEAGFAVEEYGKDFFGEDLLKKCGITSQSVIYIGFKNIDKDKLLADGKKYLKENDYENAELNFSQLVELENYNPDYLKILAEAQMNLKKYDQAIDNLSECLQILGVNYEICYSLAKCLDAVGDSEVAEIYYKKAEELRI